MTRRRSTTAAAAIALTAAIGVSGCSGSSDKTNSSTKASSSTTATQKAPSAADAWNKTQDRLGTYTSLTLTGDGKDSKGKAIHLVATGATDGSKEDLKGNQGSATFELITLDSKHYLKANGDYFTQVTSSSSSSDSSTTALMADKWIEMSSSSTSDTGVLKDFVKDMRDDSDSDGKKLLSAKATVTPDTVNGTGAWKITSEDKKLSVWVTSDGKYDLLKMTGIGSESGSSSDKLSTATFTDANKSVNITKPAGAKTIAQLAAGS